MQTYTVISKVSYSVLYTWSKCAKVQGRNGLRLRQVLWSWVIKFLAEGNEQFMRSWSEETALPQMKQYSCLEDDLETKAHLILSLKHDNIFKSQEGSLEWEEQLWINSAGDLGQII